MYIPRRYRIDDRTQVEHLLTQYPFGIFVAYDGTKPIAAHIPFEVTVQGDDLVLEGHVAKANPIWRCAPSNPEIMVIFQGPHTYISPSWYRDPNVPTWNYVAVHVYGSCELMTGDQLAAFLEKMVARYESGRPNARLWDTLDPAFREKEMRAIVGFRILASRLEAAAKMSQNRTDEDFRHITEALSSSPETADQAVSQVMAELRPDLFSE